MIRDQSETIDRQSNQLILEKQKCIEELDRRKRELHNLNETSIKQLVE